MAATLSQQLSSLFALQRASSFGSVASQWSSCLHKAFYESPAAERGVNKFLALEITLTQTFQGLSAQSASDFWQVAVFLVLQLAQEEEEEQEQCKKKKKKKRAKPNAPLAFMVVNALKSLVEGANRDQQLHFCHLQGRENQTLKEFCVRGLQDPQLTDQKLVVEVVGLFAVTDLELQVVQVAAQSLLTAKKYTALIKLFTVFSSVDWPLEATIQAMVKCKDWSAAELLARTFGGSDNKDLGKVLVEQAIAIQDVKRAHRIVYNFGLQEEYPDIDLMYCHDGLMKLIERQRWQLALSFAGNDSSLQKLLYDHMMAAGEIHWAVRLAQILDIEDFEAQIAEMVAQRSSLRANGLAYSATAAALNGSLTLDLSNESVTFCDTEASLRDAMDYFFGEAHAKANSDSGHAHTRTDFKKDQVVGLDVEWKPTSSKIAAATGSTTTTAVASILQVSSASRVFVIDLLSFHANEFLFETFLARLFTCPSLLKVGFGFDTDLKVLHQTFPERSNLLRISPFLELSAVVSKLMGVFVGNSLSNATNTILGSPLDKRMQMSNWDVRPLTAPQLTYAAIDAHCLVQMTNVLCRNEGTELPSWQNTAAEIHELVYPSPLGTEEALKAIALREKYYQDWMANITQSRVGDVIASVLTPHDVEQYWEERKIIHREQELTLIEGGGRVDEEILDTALAFLDPHTVKDLLAQPQDSDVAFVAVNAICFFADEKPCVACIEANCKLDTAQLAVLCGVSRRRVKLATPAECCEYFGFEPGTIPPFGHRSRSAGAGTECSDGIRIFVSSTLQHVQYLVCGGGSHEALLWINSKAYFALIDIEAIGDIQRGVSAMEIEVASPSSSAEPTNHHEKVERGRDYKFLADSMVARVGKWLRTIGMDVVIWDPYSVPKKTASQDHKASLLALAVCEQRIVLTRDKKLASRRDAGACFVVSSDEPFQQFQEIKAHFALKLVKGEMMSRCSRCNAKGFDVVDLDYVRNQTDDEVHPNVLEIVTEFWVCRVCHKVYWEGPKYDSNYANLLRMFDEDSIVD